MNPTCEAGCGKTTAYNPKIGRPNRYCRSCHLAHKDGQDFWQEMQADGCYDCRNDGCNNQVTYNPNKRNELTGRLGAWNNFCRSCCQRRGH